MHRLFYIILGLVMLSCAAVKQLPMQSDSSLYNKWELVTLNGSSVVSSQPLFLTLSTDSRVGGFVGCNSLGGEYVLGEEQSIRFANLITTHRYCEQAGLERQVLDMLNAVTHFNIEVQSLMLKSVDGSVVAEYTLINEGVARDMLEQ